MIPRWLAVVLFLVSVGPASGQEVKVLNKTASEWLKELKENKNPRVRRASIIALTVIGPKGEGVLTGLMTALESDPEAEVRRDVSLALGNMGNDAKGTVGALAEALKTDKEGIVREAAARSLGKLAEVAFEHVKDLGRALKDPHPETSAAAAEAIQAFGDKARLVLPELLEVAQNKKADRFTRQYALLVLIKQGQEEDKTFLLLLELAQDGEAPLNLRKMALEGLGGWEAQADRAVPVLGRQLDDDKIDPSLRLASAVALVQLGTKANPAWNTIKRALDDSDTNIRLQAIRLAGILGKDQKDAGPLLLKKLEKETNQEVTLALIQELGDLGQMDALPMLTKLTGDGRKAIREAAEAAVKKLKS